MTITASEWNTMIKAIRHSGSEQTLWNKFYDSDGNQMLYVYYTSLIGQGTYLYGGNQSGDDLYIIANQDSSYPRIHMEDGGEITLESDTDILFKEQTTQMNKFTYNSNVSNIYGGSTSGDDLQLLANSNVSKPYILLKGNDGILLSGNKISVSSQLWVNLISCQTYHGPGTGVSSLSDLTINIDKDWQGYGIYNIPWISSSTTDLILGTDTNIKFKDNGTDYFKFNYINPCSIIGGSNVTTNDLYIYANNLDTYSRVRLMGSGGIYLDAKTSIYNMVNGSQALRFFTSADDSYIYGRNQTLGDLYLLSNDIDTYSRIRVMGSGSIYLDSKSDIYLFEKDTQMFKFSYDETTSIIEGAGGSKNLKLQVNSGKSEPAIALYDGGTMDLRAKDTIYMESGTTTMFKFSRPNGDSLLEGGASGKLTIQGTDDQTYPYISLQDAGSIDLGVGANTKVKFYETTNDHLWIYENNATVFDQRDNNAFRFDSNASQIFKLYSGSNSDSYLEGGGNAGDDLVIKTNSSDNRPYIKMYGGKHIVLDSDNDILFQKGGNTLFHFSSTSHISRIYGGADSNDDLYLTGSRPDMYSRIRIKGNENIYLDSYADIEFYEQGTQMFKFVRTDGSPGYSRIFASSNSIPYVTFYDRSSVYITHSSNCALLLRDDTKSKTYFKFYHDDDHDRAAIRAYTAGEGILLSGSRISISSQLNANIISSQTIYGAWQTPIYRGAGKPGASASYEGQIIRTSGGTGEKTWLWCCVKNSADGYEWIQLGIST